MGSPTPCGWGGCQWLGFNQDYPPFNDIRVRKAVRYAIDVDAIIAGAYNNVAKRANAMIAPEILGYWKDAPQYEVDLGKAKQLLKEAGYPNGFTTEIGVPVNIPWGIVGAQIIQQQLKKIGIDAKIKVLETSAMYPYWGKESHPGMQYTSYTAILDPGYWVEWFTTDQIGKWNFWKWSNERYDELYKKGEVTMDSQKRAKIYIEMQKLMDKDVTAVWISNGASVSVSNKRIEPAYLAQFPQYRYWKIKE